jgi:hypothetical protein
MSGDVNLYTPGSRPGVTVVADDGGNIAERGDLVELVGETADGVEVALSGGEDGIGHLLRHANDYDEDEDYEEGDSVGDSTIGLRNYVDWFDGDADALEPGDLVTTGADGGVEAYDDEAGGLAFGRVWKTGRGPGAGTSDKVAVIRYQ